LIQTSGVFILALKSHDIFKNTQDMHANVLHQTTNCW